MKSKVLFLVNHEIVIYNFRKELVEELLREGHEVVISSPSGEKMDELIQMGCIHEEIEINRHGTSVMEDFKLIRYYNKLIKKVKPDIIFSYTIKPNIYGGIAASKNNVPFVPNITGLGTAVENESFLQKFIVLLYRYSFRNAQTIMFQNKENQKFFIDKNIGIDKHQLLPGSGVNLEHFKPLLYPDLHDGTHFVFISRIMKEKGINQYLEAAEYIKTKYPDTYFHICGFCEEEYEDLLKQKHEEGIIIYHGMVKDIRHILKKVHCTVHPTYYPEGLSNVLLESSASARPIITTDRSGCREVVEVGINGYLVEQQNKDDLIEKILSFLELEFTEKKNMGLNGRKKVEVEFDRNIVVDVYVNELKKAVN